MAKKRLGIDALFQTSVPAAVPIDVPPVAPAAVDEVSVDRLAPGAGQPRTYFDEAALGDLTDSVRTHGVLQPILVREAAAGSYEIVAGERRWRAAKAAGLATVPVRVVPISDEDLLSIAMIENLQREDLNPLEEAEGYLELLHERLDGESGFAAFADAAAPREGVIRLLRALNNRAAGNTKDNVVLSLEPVVTEVFGRVGRITWATFVAHRLPLLTLPEEIATALRTRSLDYTKARLIARLTADRVGGDEAEAKRLRRDLVAQAATEGLSVRGLQAEIARLLREESEDKPATTRARRAAVTTDTLEDRLEELRKRLEGAPSTDWDDAKRTAVSEAVAELLARL